AEYQSGDHARALSLLAPLIADGDAEARLLAGRIEVLTGDIGHGIELLTRQPGDSERFHAQSSLWRAHGGQPYDAGQFEVWAAETTFPPELRLGLTAAVIVHDCYAGDPAGALERAFAALGSELWESATGYDAGALLYSLHLAVLCEGSHELGHAARFEGIDWGKLAIDHGLFITSRAYVCAEYGMAKETLELTDQVLALTEQGDPFGIAGFVAAAGAAAAAMLEDVERARELLAVYRASSVHSGQLLHPESERIALAAILAVEGEEAARAEFDQLVASARLEGYAFLVMRLEHEAWRLGLTDSPDALAAAAHGVTGQLAASLRLLSQAECAEELASELLAHGRTLFAAEFLADAARTARGADNRVRAQALFAQSAELADQLPGVNTPRIGRVRVDPNLLTAREIEVSIRAASGLTNTEIADELFLSNRTVEGHLQRAYAKLGVSDRHQLLPLPADAGLPE
ncbi:MAG: response regulator transcription factor, partial [Leucobacter sp.]|nr:response regulator transcription factor [Leucobacter sp.]